MESTITAKGQTTIPKAVREHLKLKPGQRLKYFIHPDGTVVLLPTLPVTALRGILKWHGPSASLEDMDRAIAEGAAAGLGKPRKRR
jgi:AbrB family looped-hinge helix DNA binding protein